VLLPEGERRYLQDCAIATLPLAQLNVVLAPLGYVIVGSKTMWGRACANNGATHRARQSIAPHNPMAERGEMLNGSQLEYTHRFFDGQLRSCGGRFLVHAIAFKEKIF
jgi:hypothetical protein